MVIMRILNHVLVLYIIQQEFILFFTSYEEAS
jgi:hypothetical protein